jgi:2-dehydropantoate 2-reductase
MRWVVYGAGAVGGVVGGHLHLAGLATTLVARGARSLSADEVLATLR